MPDAASAAGLFTNPGNKANARAGAYTLGGFDGRAQWYNPANLARVKGTQFLLDISAVGSDITFTPSNPNQTAVAGSNVAKNEAGIFNGNFALDNVIPSISITSDFGLQDWTFAFAIHSPYSADYKYNAGNSQRWGIIDSNLVGIWYGLAAGWETPAKGLRVGAEVSLVQLQTNQRQAISLASSSFSAFKPTQDSLVEIASNDFQPNGRLGFAYALPIFEDGSPFALEIGGSVLLPVSSNGKGKLASQVPGQQDLYFVNDQKKGEDPDLCKKTPDECKQTVPMNLKVELPVIVRTGIRFEQKGVFDVEANLTWENWSQLQAVQVVTEPGWYAVVKQAAIPIVQTVPTVNDVRNYQNTIGLAVGFDWHTVPGLYTLRGGAAWEQGAIPDAYYNIGRIDRTKGIFGIGSSFHVKTWFDIDLMFSYTLQQRAVITNGDYKQINFLDEFDKIASGGNPPSTAPRAQVVNNGTYDTAYYVAGLGFVFHLDQMFDFANGRPKADMPADAGTPPDAAPAPEDTGAKPDAPSTVVN